MAKDDHSIYDGCLDMLQVYQKSFCRLLTLLFIALFAIAPFSFLGFVAQAQTIEVPEEELATESVLPVFDKTVVVRERKIKTAGRFELGGGLGLNLAEPLYEQMVYNFTASYHFDELHGANLTGYFLSEGLSKAGKDLKAGLGLEAGDTFDASRAPTVGSMFFANYQLAAYYGKISLTKQTVMNLSLYGLLGAGLVNWTDSTELALDVGVGQKLYFNNNLAFRLDLLLAIYQGPDPTASNQADHDLTAGGSALGSDDFESTIYMRPFLTGSLIYLF